MSRIGKQPVALPSGVTFKVTGDRVEVKGKLGTLERQMPEFISFEQSNDEVVVQRTAENRRARANHGLARTLLNNMVVGVTVGYTRVLVIEGVGYRAEEDGNALVFNVGFSDPKRFELPKGIKAELADRGAKITLTGCDKEVIGQACAKMRAIRPPEPYKGKGIRMQGEHIRRKVGKAGVA